MSFDTLAPFPAPDEIVIYNCDGDTRVPYERIKSYSDKEFELFIREWVTTLTDKYQVRGFGGAGDKGRDVIAKDSNDCYIYFQCKHYDHPLNASDMMPEFAKLCYHTFVGTIPIPTEYYILAPYDIGVTLNDLLANHEQINKHLVDSWDDNYGKTVRKDKINLTSELKCFIEHFDFGIVKTKTMLEVVTEHRKSSFYAFRFGGGLTVRREKFSVPKVVDKNETNYLNKICEAISEKEGIDVHTYDELLEKIPKYDAIIKLNRERFYSAENLKYFASKVFLSNEYFDDLTKQIYYVVSCDVEKSYPNGYERMVSVLGDVNKIELRHNILCKYNLVETQDRQGICHQIANNRSEFKWTNR